MNLQATKVALALAAYKAEHGNYPGSLAELCPQYFRAVPEDTFTAKPLDYRRVGKGYALYSPGPTNYERFKKFPWKIEITADE